MKRGKEASRSSARAWALLLLLVLLVFGFLVAWPSVDQWREGHKLISALQDARSVSVVEFVPTLPQEVELPRVALTPGQILELAGTVTAFYNLEFSSSGTLCYTPHHRVEIVRADGSNFSFEICFECDKYKYPGEFPRNLPPAWNAALAGFFTKAGLPPRGFNEYSVLLAAKTSKPAALI